eukprot:ANDGO_04651.mRNA.1 hypothetical protein
MMWLRNLLFSLALLLGVDALAAAAQATPSVRIALTQNAFGKFVDGIVPAVAGALQGSTFPDYRTSESGFDIAVTSVRLQTFSVPDFTAVLLANGNVQVSLHLDIMVTAHYDINHGGFPKMHTSGDINAGAANGHFTVVIDLQDNAGHLQVSIASASTDIGTFELKITGGLVQELVSFLVDIFNKWLQPPVNNAINNALTGSASQAVQRATASYPEQVSIASGVQISYALTGAVDENPQILSIPASGAVVGPGGLVPPFRPAVMPAVLDTAHMFQVLISDYLWNSVAWIYTQEKLLQKDITIQDDQNLNTTRWSLLLPNVKSLCPNAWCPMEVISGIFPNSAPTFTLSAASGMMLNVPLQMDFVVDKPDGTKAPAFSLQISLDLVSKVSVKNPQTLQIEFTYFDIAIKVLASPIGPFDPTIINDALKELCNQVIVPFANQIAAAGLPIPVVNGISFANPAVVIADGYLAVATDISYTPN